MFYAPIILLQPLSNFHVACFVRFLKEHRRCAFRFWSYSTTTIKFAIPIYVNFTLGALFQNNLGRALW